MLLRLIYTDDTALTFANQLREVANAIEDGELRCAKINDPTSGFRIMEIMLPVGAIYIGGDWHAVDNESKAIFDEVAKTAQIDLSTR